MVILDILIIIVLIFLIISLLLNTRKQIKIILKKYIRNNKNAKKQLDLILSTTKSGIYDWDKNKKPFRDARILVSEDQIFNLIFIRKFLELYGCKNFKIVENGEETLREIKEREYDIIFMDCHMPEINGHEATKIIRQGNNKIPIIAMTADAEAGTREACLAVGMNDYISKPIENEKLILILSRWFVFDEYKYEENTEDKEDNLKIIEKDKFGLTLNLEVINKYAKGNLEDVKKLVSLFLEKSNQDIIKLSKEATNSKNEDWCMIAHGLKGSAAYMGAEILTK